MLTIGLQKLQTFTFQILNVNLWWRAVENWLIRRWGIVFGKHRLNTDLKMQMEKLRDANSDNVAQMGKTFDGFQARLQETLMA